MDNEFQTEQKKGSKKPYVIAIILALALIITITATSYAYFVATTSGTGNENVITTANMAIEFSDGPQVGLENAIPGQSVTKTFTVRNTGNVATTYDIYLSDLINDFEDKTDLVYTLTSSNGANVSSQTQIPSTSSKIVSNQSIGVGETHNYTLVITFKETNDNQDDNKGKTFSTIIKINEVAEGSNVPSTPAVSAIETCPGCKFVYTTNTLTIETSTVPDEATDDYTILTSTHPYFLGLIGNETTGVIERAFACGVENGTPFCLEGYDTSKYANNVDILNTIYPSCNTSASSSNSICYGSSVTAGAYSSGSVGVYVDDGDCSVSYNGDATCYEY